MASRIPLSSLPDGLILQAGTFQPAAGATAFVYAHGTTNQVTVYRSETGGSTYSQPLTADGNGLLPGYVLAQIAIDVVATYGGQTSGPSSGQPVAGKDIIPYDPATQRLPLAAVPDSASSLYAAPSNLILVGTSFLDPSGVAMANHPATAYATPARIAAKLGVQPGQVLNLAKSGAAIRSHLANGTPYCLQAFDPGNATVYPQIAKTGITFAWYGTNDLILGIGSTVQNGVIWNYRSLISWMRACWAADYNHATVTTTGTWTPLLYSSVSPPWGQGAGCTGSTTVGDHVDINLSPGGVHACTNLPSVTVAVRLVTAPNGGTVQVSLDGTTLGTLNTFGGNFNLNSQDERGSTVYRIPITPSSSTIRLTIQSLSGGGPVYFDGWHIEASAPPLFLIGELTTPAIIQSLWANQTPTFVATANTWLDSIVTEFNDPSVRKVYLDAPLGRDTIKANGQGTTLANCPPTNLTYYGNEGLHPNDRGGQVVAGEVVKEVNRALIIDQLPPAQISGYGSFEKPPLTTLQTQLYHGSGAPLQLLDNFDTADSNSPPAGWSPLMGGWGVSRKNLALVNDMFPAPTFLDAFGRANGSVGNGWSVVSGTWQIASNELKNTAVAGGGVRPIILSPTQLDASGNGGITFTVGTVGENFAGLVFRYTDASNYWHLTQDVSFTGWYVNKVVAGSTTLVANPTLIQYAAGTVMHVELNGSTIRIWDNNKLEISITDAALATARGVGFTAWSTFAAGPTFDTFDVRPGSMPLTDAALPFNAIVRDLGAADGIFSFMTGASAPVNLQGVVFRYVDPSNYMTLTESATFGGWVLTSVIAGSSTSLGGSNYRLPATAGHVVTIQMAGDNFTVSVDGVVTAAGTHTVSGSPQGTKAGAMLYPITGAISVPTTLPSMVLDSFSAGGNTIYIPDTADYRDDVTGIVYGPFVGGSYSDQIAFMPTQYPQGATALTGGKAATVKSGTTFTFALADAGTVVETSNGSGVAATIPPHSSVAFPVGTIIEVFQAGAGQVTITAGGGVTLRSDGGLVHTKTQYATIRLRQRASDEWVISGDTA